MEKMIPIQNWLINEEPKDLLADLGIGVPISSEIGDVIENSPASDAGLLTECYKTYFKENFKLG